MITASDRHRHGSLRPHRRPDTCCYCLPWSFLGVLVLKGKTWIGKGLESRRLGARLGAPEVLIYGTSKEIVAGDRSAYVTPDFTGKTECISRVRQDHYTHT
jgi:hypothetical protein